MPEDEKAADVEKVFASVAKKYDLMNDVLSWGLHRLWKRRAIASAGLKNGDKVLDIASGTCDLAIAFAPIVGETGEVWATDINHAMLAEGRKRLLKTHTNAHTALCDCEELPFDDNTFDAATVSFGLRNMTHKDRALKEMCRVVKPGGRVVVLEFSIFIPSKSCRGWEAKLPVMPIVIGTLRNQSACIRIRRRWPV